MGFNTAAQYDKVASAIGAEFAQIINHSLTEDRRELVAASYLLHTSTNALGAFRNFQYIRALLNLEWAAHAGALNLAEVLDGFTYANSRVPATLDEADSHLEYVSRALINNGVPANAAADHVARAKTLWTLGNVLTPAEPLSWFSLTPHSEAVTRIEAMLQALDGAYAEIKEFLGSKETPVGAVETDDPAIAEILAALGGAEPCSNCGGEHDRKHARTSSAAYLEDLVDDIDAEQENPREVPVFAVDKTTGKTYRLTGETLVNDDIAEDADGNPQAAYGIGIEEIK